MPPSSSPRYPRPAAPPWRPGQQIHHGAPCQRLLQGASASRSTTVHPASVSSKAPLPAASCSVASSSQQQLSHHGAPASNKPHPAEKSTPAWLAIWCTWAGFANSQLLPDAAALSSVLGLPRSGNSSAQTSASLHPPAALRLRAPPIHGGTWASTVCAEDEFPTPLEASFAILQLRPARLQPHPAQVHQIASQTEVLPRRMRFVAGRGHCSSKSPRARILVLGTSGAHWPARWPRFELTERVAKSQLSGY